MTGLESLGGVHAVGGHLDSAGRALRSVTVEFEVFHLTSLRYPCPAGIGAALCHVVRINDRGLSLVRDHGGEDAFSRVGRDPAYLEAVRGAPMRHL